MPPVKCSESNCDQYIANPCGEITSLFGLRFALENDFSKLIGFHYGNKYTNLKEQLDNVNVRISRFEIENEEQHYQEFKSRRQKSFFDAFDSLKKKASPKYLVLECLKKHRRGYTIECGI